MPRINSAEVAHLKELLSPLINIQFQILKIPSSILIGFEPSQIGTMVGTLMDACIPKLSLIIPDNELLSKLGISKHPGILGEREGYQDYLHDSGKRFELKLLYVDSVGVEMKTPPTLREPSARLTQKVTIRNVEPENDLLLVIAYQLCPNEDCPSLYSPTIIDFDLIPVIDCIAARDHRLLEAGGKWFGDYKTPAVISKLGKAKMDRGEQVDDTTYGRKEEENKDFNEDTNFGKLKRIPCKSLQLFLKKHGAVYVKQGNFPEPWTIDDDE